MNASSELIDTLKLITGYADKGSMIANQVIDFDTRFISPENWKLDKFNNVTNTFFTLYTNEDVSKLAFNNAITDLNIVTATGISIEVNKSPIIVETLLKGYGSPVIQKFSNNAFEINITFKESGPFFWQQNSKQINKLIKVLELNQTLNIVNPQLNLIYDVTKVVVTGYSIGQDERFYSHNNISINMKSDDDKDILTIKK